MTPTVVAIRRLGGWRALAAMVVLLALRPAAAELPAAIPLHAGMQMTDVAAHAAYLEDASTQLVLDDVIELAAAGEMRPVPAGGLQRGHSPSAFWLRFELENATPSPDEWVVALGMPQLDHLEVHLPGQPTTGPIEIGDALPLEQRPIPSLSPTFSVQLDGFSRQTVWVRIESTSVISVPISAGSWGHYTRSSVEVNWFRGVLLGALGALALYNLVLFLSTRERSYLFYVAQTVASMVYTLSLSGLSVVLWPGTGHLRSIAPQLLAALTVWFAVRFARSFLNTHETTPRVDRTLQVYEGTIGVGMAAAVVLPHPVGVQLLTLVVMAVGPALGLAAVVRFPSASRSIRIYLIGLGLLLGIGVSTALAVFGFGLPFQKMLGWLRLGFLSERIVAAFALGSRIRELQDETLEAASGQLRAEEELRVTEEQLLQAQKMEAVGTLAGGIAHDFNNMLQAIIGYTQSAMARLSPGDPVREDLSEVLESGERAATLTRQLLAYSRRQVLQTRTVDLDDLIENLLRLVGRLLEANIELVFERSDRPLVVRADPAQLEQVMVNLCVNARDAMRDGGRLTLRTSITSADALRAEGLMPEADGAYARIEVEDNGQGIDPSLRDHLFEPFFTTKDTGRGTGLGLAMAHGIVLQHAGLIDFDEAPGGGTVFRIHLPITDGTTERVETPPLAEAVGGTERVLVAEDDRRVRALTAQILEAAGYSVISCDDGRAALELFAAHEREIDGAVLDLVMPEVGGRRVAEEIRRRRPGLPIVFCTGYDPADAREGLDLDGRTLLMSKPFLEAELLRAVRAVLDD